MSHLTDETLAAALEPKGGGAVGRAARAHAAACAACAALLDDARADDERISGWLTALDHPVPSVDASAVLARRRDPARSASVRRAPAHRAAWWGVAAALAGVTAAAAAVVPTSTMRRMVDVVLHPASASRPILHTASAGATVQAVAPAGVEIVPVGPVEVRFAAAQRSGVVHVMPGEGPALRVEGADGRATYAVGHDRITVANHAIDSVDYKVIVPTGAHRVRITVMEHGIYAGVAPVTEIVFPLR